MSSSTAKAVRQLKEALLKAKAAPSDDGCNKRILDILQQLGEHNVDYAILKDTLISRPVRELKEHNNADIANAANGLIKKWKEVVKGAKAAATTTTTQPSDGGSQLQPKKTALPHGSTKKRKGHPSTLTPPPRSTLPVVTTTAPTKKAALPHRSTKKRKNHPSTLTPPPRSTLPVVTTTKTKSSSSNTTKEYAFYGIDIETNVDDRHEHPDAMNDQAVQLYVKNLATNKSSGVIWSKPPGFVSLSNRSTNVMVPLGVANRDSKINALNEAIRSASDWGVAFDQVKDFVMKDSNGRKVVFIAWNGDGYDFPLMEIECIRHSLESTVSSFVDYYLDAMRFVMDHHSLWSNQVRPADEKLITVHSQLVPDSTYNAHDAKNDVDAMGECLLLILPQSNPDTWYGLTENSLRPTSYEDVDLNLLDAVERRLADESLRRANLFDFGHPLLKDREKCIQFIESLPAERLIQGDDPRLSENARLMGCIQLSTSSSRYPKTTIGGRFVSYHAIACVAQNGPRNIVDFDGSLASTFQTASHTCGNDYCINKEHQAQEDLATNIDRIGCKGSIRLVDEDLDIDKMFEVKECEHEPRCLTILTTDKESFLKKFEGGEELWNDIIEEYGGNDS